MKLHWCVEYLRVSYAVLHYETGCCWMRRNTKFYTRWGRSSNSDMDKLSWWQTQRVRILYKNDGSSFSFIHQHLISIPSRLQPLLYISITIIFSSWTLRQQHQRLVFFINHNMRLSLLKVTVFAILGLWNGFPSAEGAPTGLSRFVIHSVSLWNYPPPFFFPFFFCFLVRTYS